MDRRTLRTEVLLVLGLSLGASALWSVLQLVDLLSRPGGLGAATTYMNLPADPTRPWLSVLYEVVGLGLAVVPAVLALFLLGALRPGHGTDAGPGARSAAGPGDEDAPIRRGARMIGFDGTRPGFDLAGGLALAALIGLPGLALYLAATHWGFNATVAPAGEGSPWWALGLLVLAALKNGVLEEVVVVGYLVTRSRQLGLSPWMAVGLAALLRGVYHLYQGFGAGLGNVVMGLVFGAWYLRTGRVMPLVVAHVVIDLVAFIGYSTVAPRVDWI
ncbi:CPBP family intramembrane glutamic endopeptidase [Kytococcus sedentarius]|uniref:CPBP family intramembrane glutamic endopeptidase n=1 Tax=Kytococcus sedentarius TaxID=1276 RepID=UPI0035BBC6A4